MIRLYPDNSQPAAAGNTIRLYSDTPPAAPKPAPSSTVARASTATAAKTSIPAGTHTSRDAYFRGKGYGASNVTDSSGRPLLTFKNETAKQSQLLSDRVATKWDPTIPQKLDRKMLVNGRVPVQVTNAIRKELGAAYDDELDHRIALSLGGSNQKSNLGLEPGRTTKGRAQELNKLVNQLSKGVSEGRISHLEGQRRIAEAKGVKLPDIGAKPYEPTPVSRAPAPLPTSKIPASIAPPLPARPPSSPNPFRDNSSLRAPLNLERNPSTVPGPARKAGAIVKDFAQGFFADPEAAPKDPRFGDIKTLTPYGLGAALGMLGPFDDLAKAPGAVKRIVNLDRLRIDPDAKQAVVKTAEQIAPALVKIKGAPLKAEEVIEAAAKSDILRKGTNRADTLKSEAALLRTRQHLAALAKDGKLTPAFIDNLRVVSAEATRRGRELQALSIGADPALNTIQTRLVRQLVEMGVKTDDIVKAAEGVDFTNAKQVTEFYRKFVKPTLPELVDEYRYMNLLSSPKTHITNAFSNILQSTILRPATRLVSGAIDTFASKLTGKEQEYFVRQVPAYYRGVANGFSEATSKALKALKGESFIERPDLARIPTGSKALALGQIVPRALEASDAFFRTLAEFGEREALAQKSLSKLTKVFRGGGYDAAKMTEEGTSVSTRKLFARRFGDVEELYLDPNARIATAAGLPKEVTAKFTRPMQFETDFTRDSRVRTWGKEIAQWAREHGFDAVDFRRIPGNFKFEDEIRVLNPKVLKTPEEATNTAEINQQAARNAIELVFRKPLDAANESGHGHLLSRIDQLTNVIYQLRRVPGVKWFVPFVETPMNILKQGIEYSPLGIATLPGNTRKLEQISKMIVGSTVMAGAGALALDGRTTWSLPANTKDRAAFYEAGLQPYSVKIGDTWVSYSKLGPLAYPIAMAAAMRYYSKDDPKAAVNPNSAVAKNLLRGVAEFFSDQSYVQGLGDLLDVGRGDQTALNRIATNVPSQLVPLASLQRWITQIIDPVYRKAPSDASIPNVIENLKKGIPGFSDNVEPYRADKGDPSRRQMPIPNAFSPLPITKETAGISTYRKRMDDARKRAIKRANEDAN